jgi:(p)ppGpp synthase/HD superfamily hydrolase
VSQSNRVETMALKLAVYAERAGADPGPIVAAYRAAVELRLQHLRDVFHDKLLHPARNALILMEDASCTDAALLAAAALTETEYPELSLPAERIQREFGARIAELVREVPRPADAGDALLERLVTSPDDVALIAVAERLDHARHLHFRGASIWRPFYEQIIDVYLPFSERVSPALARRLGRWAGAFERRFLS